MGIIGFCWSWFCVSLADLFSCFNGGECVHPTFCDCRRYNATGPRCQMGESGLYLPPGGSLDTGKAEGLCKWLEEKGTTLPGLEPTAFVLCLPHPGTFFPCLSVQCWPRAGQYLPGLGTAPRGNLRWPVLLPLWEGQLHIGGAP